ncbi:hypothetical protein AO069_18135 [Pseudomonas syringae pv. syringae PD2774]|uniref:hypothetical protein n=1 Tax=Pseudomonas syringae TaxID=317 RepID=UPI000736A930|nr:hypothetical protein [Pseudomonas syringae]KTB77668.1 hypothetical protein AO069_18135 [Pseudomonas syringae pv. syringae PD2774]
MDEKKTVNPHAKLFYRPLDAAIRWCNLMAYETQILESTWDCPTLLAATFPQWPCLHANIERILDAIRNKELRYGALGTTVTSGTPVDIRLLTIRHSDLKWWMLHHYPDQRPSFLFSPIAADQETIRYGTYLILQADRDALQVQLKATEATLQALMGELTAAGLERENLRSLAENKKNVSDHSKTSFLNVIGALVNIMLGSSKAGRRHSIFDSQASIVDSITAHYSGVAGLSKRSLDEKFAAGRRSLAQAKR